MEIVYLHRRIENRERFGRVQSEGCGRCLLWPWWLADSLAGLAEHRLPSGLNVGGVDLTFSGEGWKMIRGCRFEIGFGYDAIGLTRSSLSLPYQPWLARLCSVPHNG